MTGFRRAETGPGSSLILAIELKPCMSLYNVPLNKPSEPVVILNLVLIYHIEPC